MGAVTVEDVLIKDGLWDPYDDMHMGNLAELCAKRYNLTREAQDAFTITSYEKAQTAQAKGWFNTEIHAVEIDSRKGKITVSQDEEPQKARFDKIPELRPAFEKDGTITAANASKLNDGAAALVISH